MWFKHRAWVPLAWLASAGNVVATYFAAGPGEALHATAHALLGAAFAVGAMRLSYRNRQARAQLDYDPDVTDSVRELEARLDELDMDQDSQRRLPELEERLDFLERALVEIRNRAHVPLDQKSSGRS